MNLSNAITERMVEQERMRRLQEINTHPADRAQLEAQYGRVWDTAEMSAEFEITGFAAPYAVAKRLSDGQVGSLEFQHMPRFYFNFVEDK